MKLPLLRNLFVFTAIFLFLSASVQAASVNWTFDGAIDAQGVFSTFDIDDDWTLSITFDPGQTGISSGSSTAYAGNATFNSIAASYGASDTSATIRIADAPNSVTIVLEQPDASFPALQFKNLPGTAEVEHITLSLLFNGGTGSEDISDYIQLDTLDLNSASILISAIGSFVPPTGDLSTITVNAVPLPAAAWLFGSALLGLGAVKRRKA